MDVFDESFIRMRFALMSVLLLRLPANVLGDAAPSSLAGRCHSLPSLASATGGGRVAPYLLRYAQSAKQRINDRNSLMQMHQ